MVLSEIEIFKMKKLLKQLRDAKGNGTSMISLIIPPKEQLSKINKLLIDEYGTATNIKSKVNRLSVLTAIVSTQNKLKTYNKTPPNGLGLFVGEIVLDDNKIKKVAYGIEPIKPVNTSLYLCDSKFHVNDLLGLFESESKYGFVIIDGHGTLFATLQGNTPVILQNVSVDLPKKHGRGGQSSVRFARLRIEKRLAYVKKIAEICTSLFISNSKSNVDGLILGGLADLKHELKPLIDQRLSVLKIVDTNYGGKNGLNQAIELSDEFLKDVKYLKEKKILQKFFDEINLDTGKYCYGYNATMAALESGAIEELIVYENLNVKKDEEDFVDWIAENYNNYGCMLYFVSNSSGEGSQFVDGFGGIGGILRYKINMDEFEDNDNELSSLSIDDEDIF